MRRLDGKVALVSGAARAIGEAIAEALAHNGAKVVIGDLLDESRATTRPCRPAPNLSSTAVRRRRDERRLAQRDARPERRLLERRLSEGLGWLRTGS